MTLQERRANLAVSAAKIDQITNSAMEIFSQAHSFEKSLSVATAIVDLRAALTDDVMKPIMALMNSPLGFMTDRGPQAQREDSKTPYTMEQVRECYIEASLRGLYPVGNEFNIIQGRCYAALNGLRRKVMSFNGISDFKDAYEVPRLIGDKGAIVIAKATWKIAGKADEITREIPIKVNSFMGSDAILGKAQRKLYKAVLDRLTGMPIPESEVGEDDSIAANKPQQKPIKFAQSADDVQPEAQEVK